MATATRSRPRKAAAKENGGAAPKKVVDEGLSVFKSEKFDPDSFVHSKCSLNEKEIRQLCSNLLDLKRVSAEEMRKSVYANYSAFIRTSKEISDLVGELSAIRNLLSTQAALIHGLADGVHMDSIFVKVTDGLDVNGALRMGDGEPTALETWSIEFPDHLDVLLAERRVDEALDALEEGERVASEARETESLSPEMNSFLEEAIAEGRKKLADQLGEVAFQASTRVMSSRLLYQLLKGSGMALVLNICSSMLTIRSTSIACKVFTHQTPHMEELTRLLSLRLFFPLLLKLPETPCRFLLFRPIVEQALDANLNRIEESTAALAAADDWVLTYPTTTMRQPNRSSVSSMSSATAFQHKLTSGANRFNFLVQPSSSS